MASEDPTAKIMQSVARALSAGRSKEAVHQFVQALSHDTTLKRVDLPPLLAQTLGKSKLDALIQAFAKHPCMVCRRGLLICDDCEGRGYFRDGRICDACLGLGTTNCDFCAGSGWITYKYVPAGLQEMVLLARSKLALAEARALLAAPLPGGGKTGGEANRKTLAQRLLQANRLMGAFDNAVGIARSLAEAGAGSATTFENVESACSSAASRLVRRIRKLLQLLSENAKVQAAQEKSPRQRRLNERRTQTYASLAKSTDFKGTSLFHVYLRELQSSEASPEPSTQPGPRGSESSN